MNPQQLEHYRKKLSRLADREATSVAQRREEVLRPLGGEAGGGISDLPLHPSDLAADSAERDVEAAVFETEGHLLADINAALARIEAGTFGKCESCGKGIAKNRLDAVPYARICKRCAESAAVPE